MQKKYKKSAKKLSTKKNATLYLEQKITTHEKTIYSFSSCFERRGFTWPGLAGGCAALRTRGKYHFPGAVFSLFYYAVKEPIQRLKPATSKEILVLTFEF
ncbi:MAG TPA: hypothetical protein VEB40_02755 [Flavipsychrobacter sp.]|nr:hypothetical protein [Flavipsychrobacter sp.]